MSKHFDPWGMFDSMNDRAATEAYFNEVFGESFHEPTGDHKTAKDINFGKFQFRPKPFVFDNTPGIQHLIGAHELPRQAWVRLRLMPHPDEVNYRYYHPSKSPTQEKKYLSYAEHIEWCSVCAANEPCAQSDQILRNVTKPIICL